MAAKIISNIIFIIALTSLQIAFISGLAGWASSLNLILVALIFILGFGSLDLALWWVVGAGLVLELFSFLPFGAYLISFGLAVIAANFLLKYFFTNRSLYSFLALAGLATVIYEFIINAIIFIFNETNKFAPISSGDFLAPMFKQIVMNLLFTLIIFYIIYFLGRNLKPVFLVKSKK